MNITTSAYAMLADLILLVHAGFVAFVILGQTVLLLGWWRDWRWTRCLGLRIIHLAAILVVVALAWLDMWCPLTLLENHFRHLAGEEGYQMSFIGDWLYRLLYYRAPPWVFTLAYTLFGLLVVLTWLLYPPRREQGAG